MPDRMFYDTGSNLEKALRDLGIDPVDLGVDLENNEDVGGSWIDMYSSSNVDAIAYNPVSQRMLVAFRRKYDRPEGERRLYQYFGVPDDLYDDLFSAGSPGGTVWDRLRRAGYSYNRLS